MCDPVSATIAAVAMIGTAALTKPPKLPTPQDPVQPQAAKQPDTGAIRKRAQQVAGNSSATSLTGAKGVVPGSLNLGQNTLLGAAATGAGSPILGR